MDNGPEFVRKSGDSTDGHASSRGNARKPGDSMNGHAPSRGGCHFKNPMRKSIIKKMITSDLISAYIELAEEYAELIDRDEMKLGNKKMDALLSIADEIKSRDFDSWKDFTVLFDHSNRDVRWISACQGATFSPESAKSVLENEALARPDWRSHFIKSKLRSLTNKNT